MRNILVTTAIALAALAAAPALPALRAQSKVPDLSGDWAPDRTRGGMGQSLSLSDIGGRKRGNEDDIPYQPWARTKTLSEKTSTGPNSQSEETTDPQVVYCEPPGVPHIYLWPIKTRFVQTQEAVYILYELGPTYIENPALGLYRRLDRHRLHGAEKFSSDRGVNPQAAEREASGQPQHLVRTLTPIR